MSDDADLLRHTLAVIAYRGGNVLRDAPAEFGETRVRHDTRSAVEILAHINDVLAWGMATARGETAQERTDPIEWDDQVDAFYDILVRFDEALSAADAPRCSPHRLFGGPLADSLTHVGQLATLRKLAGSPVRGESYFAAEIETGRVGRDQAEPKRPFM